MEPKEAESAWICRTVDWDITHTWEKKKYKTNVRPAPRHHWPAAVQGCGSSGQEKVPYFSRERYLLCVQKSRLLKHHTRNVRTCSEYLWTTEVLKSAQVILRGHSLPLPGRRNRTWCPVALALIKPHLLWQDSVTSLSRSVWLLERRGLTHGRY